MNNQSSIKKEKKVEPFSTVTSAILSGIVYDFVKKSTKITLEKFKSKVKGWLIDDETAEELVNRINQIHGLEDLNESAIARKFEQDKSIMNLLKTIQLAPSINQVIQTHSGSGDNVAGDKHVTYKSEN